jgi:hypothetical protein
MVFSAWPLQQFEFETFSPRKHNIQEQQFEEENPEKGANYCEM